jgi:hypothetical protein
LFEICAFFVFRRLAAQQQEQLTEITSVIDRAMPQMWKEVSTWTAFATPLAAPSQRVAIIIEYLREA